MRLFSTPKTFLLLSIWGLSSLLYAQQKFYVPHFTFVDEAWKTTIALANTSLQNLPITLSAISDQGELLQQVKVVLNPAETRALEVRDWFPNLHQSRGWIELDAKRDTLQGTTIFRHLAQGGSTSLPIMQQPAQNLMLPYLEETASKSSGFALVNTSDRWATVLYSLIDIATNKRQIRVATLAPQSRAISMLADLFEGVPGERFRLEIKSTRSILAYGLSFENDLQQIVALPAQAYQIVDKKAAALADLDAVLGDNPIGGLSLAVTQGDQQTLALAAGIADQSTAEPMSIQHSSAVGSITKTFVATLMLMLHEEQVIDIDQTLDHWFPEVANASQISLKMMLNHTSGITEYNTDAFVEALLSQPGKIWSPEELVDFALVGSPDFEPGTAYNYSNSNYLLSGMVIEKATGRKLADLLQEYILDPLGLDSMYLRGFESAVEPTTTGFIYDPMELLNSGPYIPSHLLFHGTSTFADGGLVATPSDLNHFIRSLLKGDLLQPETLELMLTPSEQMPLYALGITLNDDGLPDEPTLGHDGAYVWGVANMAHFLETDTTISFVYNVYAFDFEYLRRVLNQTMVIAKIASR